jgi:hypothetical protein
MRDFLACGRVSRLAGRQLDPRAERVLFALAANRALAASWKLAAVGRITSDVHIAGLDDQRRGVLPGNGLAAPDRAESRRAGVLPGSPTC